MVCGSWQHRCWQTRREEWRVPGLHSGTENSRRNREEIFRSPGLKPYLVWVVGEASKTTVRVCGCGATELELVEEQGWGEEGYLILTLGKLEGS